MTSHNHISPHHHHQQQKQQSTATQSYIMNQMFQLPRDGNFQQSTEANKSSAPIIDGALGHLMRLTERLNNPTAGGGGNSTFVPPAAACLRGLQQQQQQSNSSAAGALTDHHHHSSSASASLAATVAAQVNNTINSSRLLNPVEVPLANGNGTADGFGQQHSAVYPTSFFDPLMSSLSPYTTMALGATTTKSGGGMSAGVEGWTSSTASMWPWNTSGGLSSAAADVVQSSAAEAILAAGGYDTTKTMIPSDTTSNSNSSLFNNYNSYLGMTFRGLAPTFPQQMTCFDFGQPAVNPFTELYCNAVSNPLQLAIGGGGGSELDLHHESPPNHNASSLKASTNNGGGSTSLEQLQQISSSSTSSSSLNTAGGRASGGGNICQPVATRSSNYQHHQQQQQHLLNGQKLNVSVNNGGPNDIWRPIPTVSSIKNKNQKSSERAGGKMKGGSKQKGSAKSRTAAEPAGNSSSITSSSSSTKSVCECSNCAEIIELEKRGLPIGNRKRVHRCDIPGCYKVYSKSSHLKAHLRWHDARPLVPQKKRLFDPPEDVLGASTLLEPLGQ